MALPARASIVEQGWPLGEFQDGAVELEPEGAAQTITGLIGDDGLPYRRGGATYKSNAAVGSLGLHGVVDANLLTGRFTAFIPAHINVSVVAVACLDPADDATPVTLLTIPNTPTKDRTSVPFRMPVFADRIVTHPSGLMWGGSTKAIYSTGTADATNGSVTVVGHGTLWSTNAEAGMFFTTTTDDAPGVVASVDSDTQLTLSAPYVGPTVAGVAYQLAKTDPGVWTGNSGTFPNWASTPIQLAFENRLLLANRMLKRIGSATVGSGSATFVRLDGRLSYSEVGAPTNFPNLTNYHQFTSRIIGLGALRDTLLVFTAAGVYALSNMALDLTDSAGNPQQRKELVNADLVAWTHEGIAPWRGMLLVPALDGVWLFDSVSGPRLISQRIADLYLSYVRAGYKTGVAEVFNGHYLLPILDSSNVWVDTLACRLEPGSQGGGYAWSQLSGSGAQVAAFAERSSNPPVLLGASRLSTSRVTDCTGFFSPAAAIKNDPDGTTHTWRLTTRNIKLGDRPTAALSLTANYSLVDAASDNPTLTCEASVDGGSYTTLTVSTGTTGTTAGEQDGSQTVYWEVQKAGRFIRFRFTCSNPAASLQFKRFELRYRPRGN